MLNSKCFNFQREKCGLVSLALAGCEMSKVGANHLLEGLRENTSLTELNVNGLEVVPLSSSIYLRCCIHSTMNIYCECCF